MTIDKNDTVKTIVQQIIHDFRTPLIAIKSGASGIDGYLPVLIEGYQHAKNAELIEKSIQPRHLNTLSCIVKNIEASINEMSGKLDELERYIKNHM
jgi:two-component system CAI-1 autoinducer sensor kinase/phosphatase CqsS